jgi:hypothetical protein
MRDRLIVGLSATASLVAVLAAAAVSANAAGFVPATGSPFASPGVTGSIALGDLNGDAKTDAVATNPGAAKVTVLIGNGQGQLTPTTPVATGGTKPSDVALADFNNDGKLDAVVANDGSTSLSVLLGDGAGGLSAAAKSPFPTEGLGTASLVVGNFNGDFNLDVAVVGFRSGDVSIMLGDGQGGLAPSTGSPFVTGGFHPGAAAAGDFNGDGKLDLAVANESGNVSIMAGDGAGTLSRSGASPFGLSPAALGAGDFNGDGKLDVAVANTGGTIKILTGTGTGALTALPAPAPVITVGGDPSSLVVSDLDRDGKLDLATANAGTGDLSVLLGDGAAHFAPAPGTPVSTGGNAPSALAAADLNGDGKLDLVTVNASSASVSVLLNGVAPPLSSFLSFPAAPVVGQQVLFAYSPVGPIAAIDWDLNGDGVFDDAHGATAARAFQATGSYPVSLRVTDIEGLTTTTTRLIAVGLTAPSLSRIAPLPGSTLISPFPIVRVTGRTAPRGARIKALEVFAPAGARITVDCKGKGCPFRKWRRTAGGKTLTVDPLKGRFLAAGVTLQVRVYKAGLIGKYTRIVIRKLKPPTRSDLCLAPGRSNASQCPVS